MKQTLGLCVKDWGGDGGVRAIEQTWTTVLVFLYICICMYRTNLSIYLFFSFLKRTVQKERATDKKKEVDNTNLSIHTFLINRKSIKYEKREQNIATYNV